MGAIRNEVRNGHLNQYSNETDIITPFVDGFFITWATKRKAYGTEISLYFLNPEDHIRQTYGFDQEIMLAYSSYDTMQSRTIQACEQFLLDEPAKGRVEKLNYILISEDNKIEEWIRNYIAVNQETRIIIGISADELRQNKGNQWFFRNVFDKQLFGRNLFDYRLPLNQDTYFFGRRDIIASYYDAIKRSENRGLFGLRKTGKTSVIFKIKRLLDSEKTGVFLYYDCKSPNIRKLRWFELLEKIANDIIQQYSCNVKKKEADNREISVVNYFFDVIKSTESIGKVAVIFDEIEYISPKSLLDTHWEKDFIDFWQTFWSCQSQIRNLSAIIIGVNPYVTEVDVINGVQNPLFGIVSHNYLTGLTFDDMKAMVKKKKKKMGMRFDEQSMHNIYDRYGGHPLLTRIACSLFYADMQRKQEKKPFDINLELLKKNEESRDSDLTFYCAHVVSEIKQFYKDEYTMLELLSSKQIFDFIELTRYPEAIKHLEHYGLLKYDINKIPLISIQAIARYIGLEYARREGRKTIFKIIPNTDRAEWIRRRVDMIMEDLKFLEKLIKSKGLESLYGSNSFAEADQFVKVYVCHDKGNFENFINVMNRCFVESIDSYGKSISSNEYYWKTIKIKYPGLWFALNRIKIYRHNQMHLELTTRCEQELAQYLDIDLEGQQPGRVNDLYFVLQQCTIDGLLSGIHTEINTISE
ncbi:MAG: hypothetical protein HZC28_19570 [Spirochaetes bacterium]|nr:hypothetical protein [Spirochaetota bacterium]